MPLDIMKEVSVFPVINLSLRNSLPEGEGYVGKTTRHLSQSTLCLWGLGGVGVLWSMLGWALDGGQNGNRGHIPWGGGETGGLWCHP